MILGWKIGSCGGSCFLASEKVDSGHDPRTEDIQLLPPLAICLCLEHQIMLQAHLIHEGKHGGPMLTSRANRRGFADAPHIERLSPPNQNLPHSQLYALHIVPKLRLKPNSHPTGGTSADNGVQNPQTEGEVVLFLPEI